MSGLGRRSLARRWLLLGLLCLGAAGDGRPETVLRLGTLTSMEPLSPVAVNGLWYATGYMGFNHMPLITYRAPQARFGPCLARSWEVAPDNRSILFRLAAGARWHDGRPVTADDIAFTLAYLKEHQIIGQLWRFLDRVEVEGPDAARVFFTEPVAYYQLMSFPWPKMLPRHIWQGVEEPWRFAGAQAMVGSGPFAFVGYDVDARVASLERVPDHWGPPTAVERLEIRYYGTTDALVLALKRGDVDAVMGANNHLPPTHIPALEGAAGIGITQLEDSGVPLTLVFNGRQGPTRDAAFRRAVALAVDSPALIRSVFRGRGRVPEMGFVPPAAWTYGGPFAQVRRDTARSRALLDSLGYLDVDGDGRREGPDGAPFTLQLVPETWQSHGEAVRATELIVYQLGQVGLAAAMDKYVLEDEYDLLWEKRSYQAYVGHATHASVRDGGHVYFADYRDYSYGTFTEPDYMRLLDRITGAADEATYLEAVRQAQAYNARHIPGLALVWGRTAYAYRQDRFEGWLAMAGYGFPNYDSWAVLQPVSAAAAPAQTPARGRWWWALGALVALGGWMLWRRG